MPTSDAEVLDTLLARVMRLVAIHADSPAGGLARTPLSMAEGVLLVDLLDSSGVTQQQLADRLSLDKSRVSRLCSALESKRLVARQRDDANRRNLLVRITPTGAAAATQLREIWHRRHERVLSAMTSDERHGLLVGLRALARELTASHLQSEFGANHDVHIDGGKPEPTIRRR
jgi:DNA-binding MarR family transcriptional regulator